MLGKTNKWKSPVKPYSTNVRDYPSLLSGFEKESLAAEAQLAAVAKRSDGQSLRSQRFNPLLYATCRLFKHF
jgi:hypothetical protein